MYITPDKFTRCSFSRCFVFSTAVQVEILFFYHFQNRTTARKFLLFLKNIFDSNIADMLLLQRCHYNTFELFLVTYFGQPGSQLLQESDTVEVQSHFIHEILLVRRYFIEIYLKPIPLFRDLLISHAPSEGWTMLLQCLFFSKSLLVLLLS